MSLLISSLSLSRGLRSDWAELPGSVPHPSGPLVVTSLLVRQFPHRFVMIVTPTSRISLVMAAHAQCALSPLVHVLSSASFRSPSSVLPT